MSDTLHIFPSTAAVEACQRSAVNESGVILGVTALTPRRLTQEICRTAGEELRPISDVGRKLILEEIVRRHYAGGNGSLAPLTDFPGFVDALDLLFGELKQALMDPAQFAAGVKRLPRSAHLAELAGLFARYNEALAGLGVADRHDRELAALNHLRKGGELPPLFQGFAAVAMHAIYDLTPLQLALVAEISRRLPLKLHLPYNPDREALYAYVAKTAEAVEALDNADLSLEPVFAEPAGTFLTPLLDALHGGGTDVAAPFAPPGPMALLAAPGAYRECEEIGRRIRGLLQEGVQPVDVAVLFRDLERYGPMMEDVCRRFRIPVSYRRGAPLSGAPLVRAALAPFAVARERFGREALVSLCNSSYFAAPGPAPEPALLEEVLLDARYVDETLGTVEEVLKRRIAGLRKGGRESSREEQVLRFLRPLLAELRRFRGEKTLAEFVALLEGFIDRYRLFRRGIEAADPRALKRDASAVVQLRRVLADLESDMRTLGLAARPLSPAGFVELLHEGMEGMFLAGEHTAGVAIMNFHDARGLSFQHLFIGGLNDGITPKRHEGHPFFKDGDKLLWRRFAGLKSFRTAAEKAQEEPLLFWMAVGCAAGSLTFSYSYMDSRGNAMLPSPFLDDILAVVPLEESRPPVSAVIPELASCMEREELLNAAAAHSPAALSALAGSPPLAESVARIAAVAGIEGVREAFFAAGSAAPGAGLSSPFTGSLGRPDIVAELRDRFSTPPGNSFAPTHLEEYGCCPFRYFLRRLVGIAAVEKPAAELEAKDEGNLVHELLYRFFRRLADEGRLPLRDVAAAKVTLRETAAALFASWEAERHTGEPLLWEIGKERLLAILERMVEMEGAEAEGFVPRLFEHPIPGLEVEDSDGSRINLTGKIDRADTAEGGRLRVVDYKLAGNRQKYRNLLKKESLGVTSFQMPVYLLAALQELGTETGGGPVRLSALYWLLGRLDPLAADFSPDGKEDFTGFFASKPDEREGLGDDNFLNRLCMTVRHMKNGEFPIIPRECEFCNFGSVCRYVETQIMEEEK